MHVVNECGCMAQNKSPCRLTTLTKKSLSYAVPLMCNVCKHRTVYKCSGCQKAFYCSREHQKLDWRKHRKECNMKVNEMKNTRHDITGPKDCFTDTRNLQCYNDMIKFLSGALKKVGLCVIDNFIHNEIAEQIKLETDALYLTPGVFGEAEQPSKSTSSYRSDLITWVTGQEKLCPKIKELTETIDYMLATTIKSEKFPRVIHKSRVQVSCFPKNTFGYKCHIDNPRNNGRLLTAVYFCNKAYNRETDGGVSRFYIKSNTKCVDIEPKFNRAIVYWSDSRNMHETLPCRRNLFSLTSWYYHCENPISARDPIYEGHMINQRNNPVNDTKNTTSSNVRTQMNNEITHTFARVNNQITHTLNQHSIPHNDIKYTFNKHPISNDYRLVNKEITHKHTPVNIDVIRGHTRMYNEITRTFNPGNSIDKRRSRKCSYPFYERKCGHSCKFSRAVPYLIPRKLINTHEHLLTQD